MCVTYSPRMLPAEPHIFDCFEYDVVAAGRKQKHFFTHCLSIFNITLLTKLKKKKTLLSLPLKKLNVATFKMTFIPGLNEKPYIRLILSPSIEE